MRRLRRARERQSGRRRTLRRRALATGTAVVVSLAAGTGLVRSAVPAGDRHQAIVVPDADEDFLTDREEMAIGWQSFTADQNRNTFRDGVELAVRCADAIASLPSAADANAPGSIYKQEMPLLGVELCAVCGQAINMGTVKVINRRLDLEVELPIIALHYLEHGSFNYAGESHKGRSNVPVLLRTLELRYPHEPDAHQLPLDYSTAATGRIAPDANDLDGDLLADGEELAAGLNPYHADQNENLLPDGVELAQRCAEIIDGLPVYEPDAADTKGIYRINFMLRGLEWCEICGESVNMGYWQIVNPARGLSMDVPVIAWHAMQHGSFSSLGDVHGAGRTNLAALAQLLEFPVRCGDLGVPRSPADLNGDCRVDLQDLGELADRWLDSTDPDPGLTESK